jgi:hypothetical protein
MEALETGRSMNNELRLPKVMMLSLVFATFAPIVNAQSLVDDLKEVQNPVKRSEKALTFANLAFENARAFYFNGDVKSGDAQLEKMTYALNECLRSLGVARKPQLYKRAEQKVASLQRRIQGVVDEIQLQDRGWAAYTERKLDEIHDKLFEGALRK